MDYIDMRLAENVWNSEVIFAEIKAMGYTGGTFHAALRHPARNVKCVRQNSSLRNQPGYQLEHDWGDVEVGGCW